MENRAEMELKSRNISLRETFDKKTVLLLSFAFIILLIYFILEKISFITVIETFLDTNILLLMVGGSFTFIAVLLDAVSWKILLGVSSIRPSIKTTYRIQLSSFSYGLLIPSAGAVEVIMRVFLGTQEFRNDDKGRKATSGEVLSSVVTHKLLGLLAFIPISVFIALSMFDYLSDIAVELGYSPFPQDFNYVFVIFISLLSVFIVSLFVLIAMRPNIAKKLLNSIIKGISFIPFIGKYFRNTTSDDMIDDFSIQFSFLAKRKNLSMIALILVFLAQIAHWVSILLILHSVDILIALDQVAAVNFLAGTVDLIPVGIPGMAGLKEISLSIFIEYGLGISTTEAFSGALLVQLVKFYFVIIVGLIAYAFGKTRIVKHNHKA
jgi:uncharacterized protein (TIRG00374 family)